MKTFFSLPRLALIAFFSLGAGFYSHATLPASPHAEVHASFACGDIKADPVRNMVYLVDQSDNEILEIDTASGLAVKTVPIADGSTNGELAISVDDSTLYLAETAENKILVFSLPDLTPQPSLTLNFPPALIATGAGGRLYASEYSNYAGLIVEVSTSTGTVLQTFGSSERYYYAPLLRTNAAGTNLYAGVQSLSGTLSIEKYDISGTTVSSATGYSYDSENMEDFTPDETNNRIYVMNGGIYGVNVINTTNDNYATVWTLTGAYGVAVSYSPTGTVVFGASGDSYSGDVKTYSRTDGTPLADNVVTTTTTSIKAGGLAATPNGNAIYVRQESGNAYIGIIGLSTLSLTPDLFGGDVKGTNMKKSSWFGFYTYNSYPLVYQYYLGYEYVYSAGTSGVYLYDYGSHHFWYTDSTSFPFVYDFTLNAYLYYYKANTPHRHFYDYATNSLITE